MNKMKPRHMEKRVKIKMSKTRVEVGFAMFKRGEQRVEKAIDEVIFLAIQQDTNRTCPSTHII
jgi:hypothetical protein